MAKGALVYFSTICIDFSEILIDLQFCSFTNQNNLGFPITMVYVSYKQFTEYAECSAFLPSSELGLPQPLAPVLGGGAHWLAREGLGESQFRRGDIHSDTPYIYVRTLWIYPSKRVTSSTIWRKLIELKVHWGLRHSLMKQRVGLGWRIINWQIDTGEGKNTVIDSLQQTGVRQVMWMQVVCMLVLSICRSLEYARGIIVCVHRYAGPLYFPEA